MTKSQQHFVCQVDKQCVGCSFEAVTANFRFLVKGSHAHCGGLSEVCDLPLSQTDCHGCKNETFHMPTLRIKLPFQFGYGTVQRVIDYGLHMQQVV